MEPTEKSESYPVFKPNQVLSDVHLNQAFNYLDEQERLTRANLIGIGIICGLEIRLEVKSQTEAIIHLSKGCGVTSEGYLIEESEDVSMVSYREYKLPGDPDYLAFKDSSSPSTQYSLWELFPAGEPDTTQLTTSFLNDKAVLLFLELKREDLRNCSPNNCDDKGSVMTATVRRLLMRKVDLNNINNSPLVEFQKLSITLPEIPMRRINISTPEDLHNYQDVFKKYFADKTNGQTIIERLLEGIDHAYGIIKLLLPDLSSFDKEKFKSFFNFQANKNIIAIQYYYDFLRDLTSAYHELRTALLQPLTLCLPENDYFPRHLTLGALDSSQTIEWRTGYFPSPAVASPQCKLGELRFLFERLNQMVLNFNILSEPKIPIKITPSLFGLKHLSGKSMPFYYKPEIREYWDATRRGEKAREILSWHDDDGSPDHVRNPLQYDLEPYNIFRVEGHVSKNVLDVTTSLGNLVKDKRLPISILYLNADAVGDFLEKHFAIEHEAGVMRGGTFVVLYGTAGPNANLILCDFALPYRIETRSPDCLCRVAIRECRYEWFDSRRHLSSLARLEYKVSRSREAYKELLAKYYVILIYRYEIQGKSIIAGTEPVPVQVKVPIAELVNGQISAIAKKLNEKFPGGLVFDHDVATNKLVIRYFNDQTFRIEWGGLQGNQIRYAYTPEGIYRWQKGTWESFNNVSKYKVECRLLNDYRPDEYTWLQKDDYYSAKYPTPVPMPTSKDLIEWENMIQKRAKTKELPIRNLLRQIRHLLDAHYNAKNPQVQVVLIGSWANGSWVPKNINEYRFPRGFFSLRKKITGKTLSDISDIDLLVNIKPGSGVKSEDISILLKSDEAIRQSGYKINIILGKKDAQGWIQM